MNYIRASADSKQRPQETIYSWQVMVIKSKREEDIKEEVEQELIDSLRVCIDTFYPCRYDKIT